MPESAKPLRLRIRPDLVINHETFGGRSFVVVKDPVALKYYRLREEEFAILSLLDGRRSLDEIQELLEIRFAPQKFEPTDMSQFIADMHRSGLVLAELPGQAEPLLERRGKNVRRAWLQRLMSPLSIRFRGIDPTPLLDVVYPRVRWCFTKPALVAAALLIAAAVGLVVVQHREVFERLPTWREFFTPTNVLLLMAVMAGIKVVHEFGHGLTCRHFGGEVHELGVMFLVFAPCLYCNVSDAWRLPKRSRIAVGAAGIIVELVLAAVAVFGWWFSEPGLFHQLCLGVMFVSGVSTLLINGNPLMRYDGYFILADLMETPNLAEQSAAVVRRDLARLCFGIRDQADPQFPETNRTPLAAYALASTVYRFCITFSIVLFLIEWLRPYGLDVVARAFGVAAFGGMLFGPTVRFVRFLMSLRRREEWKRARAVASMFAAAVGVALICFLPMPQCVWATLELEPHDVEKIYVDVTGRVAGPIVRPGETVAAGSVLAALTNVDLEYEIARLAGRAAEQRAELTALRRERYHSESAALRIPELAKSLAALEELLTEKRAEFDRLTLRTSRPGVVLPPAETPAARETALGELPAWSGLPTDPENGGATLAEGTLFCQIGDPQLWQALLVVDQTDLPLVSLGQIVDIRFDEKPNVVATGTVEEISQVELSESPKHLSNKAGGELATKTDGAGIERPLKPTYRVRVVLIDPEMLLRIGLRGTARIHVRPQPLATRVVRWVQRTFHFDL